MQRRDLPSDQLIPAKKSQMEVSTEVVPGIVPDDGGTEEEDVEVGGERAGEASIEVCT